MSDKPARVVALPRDSARRDGRSRKDELRALLDPAWRFTLAKQLVADKVKRFTRFTDPQVLRLVEFLRKLGAARTADQLDAVEQEYWELFWAREIHISEERGPRYHLEAMILAGSDQDEIVEYLGLPASVVEIYESAFFDLRRFLDNPTVLRTYLFGKGHARGNRDGDRDLLWKQLALSQDMTTLRVLWEARVMTPEELAKMDALLASNSRRDALEAQSVRQINQFNSGEVLAEYISLRHMETERQKVELVTNTPAAGGGQFVEAFLQAIQFAVAPFGVPQDHLVLELGGAIEQLPALMRRMRGGGSVSNANVFRGNGQEGNESADEDS